MKRFVLFLILFFCVNFFPQQSVLAFNPDLLNEKIELETIYSKAASNGKLSKKDLSKLNHYKADALSMLESKDSNIVPILYLSGNTYRVINKKEDAIECYRTIVEYFPTAPVVRKSIMYLRKYGITYSTIERNSDGKIKILPDATPES